MGNIGERRIRLLGAALLATAALGLAACSSDGSDGAAPKPDDDVTTTTAPDPADELRLNQLQVMGTHNSFHVAAEPEERALLEQVAQNAAPAVERAYSHPPLEEQLATEKVRQLELDVFVDSEGGRFATPDFRRQAGIEPLELPDMDQPGTKVLHEQDIDYHSVCPTLVACLTEVKTWSDANPDHVPVAIHLQFKDGPLIFDVPEQAPVERWTPEAMDGLDDEIRSVFEPEDLITPDDVRGERKTLEEAVLDDGWPTLGDSRGKVMFLMINAEPYRSIYLQDHDGLEGRILFTNAEPGQPDASYVGLDDPLADGKEIADLVEKGYLVRTRADQPGVEAKNGTTSRLEAALESGAQWISTDYPGPDGAKDDFDTGYVAELPGFLAARCNPVSAPKGCKDATVEPD